MLESIISSNTTNSLSIDVFLYCSLASILLGIIIAIVHRYTSKYTKNFLMTLVILPILVQTIIIMVNGSLGTSIAIMGAFSLVRFRSLPGTSREISSVLFAMTIGLATGMGQLLLALILTIFVSLILIVFSKIKFGNIKENTKKLVVTIPENLDYNEVFDEVFATYLKTHNLEKVKTTNLGSLFELTYLITLKKNINEKEFIDELRIRNGNLKIILTHPIDDNIL